MFRLLGWSTDTPKADSQLQLLEQRVSLIEREIDKLKREERHEGLRPPPTSPSFQRHISSPDEFQQELTQRLELLRQDMGASHGW